ncbi:MAG: FAD-binding oxidoreductase [Candidatus Thorarchaeota archaeon]|nr:FAD-binding oxidoreductase [Candidatus Thorarchaeota archaeon]
MTAVKSLGTHPLLDKILSIVGEDRVNDNPVIISSYTKDASHLTAERPGIIVMPESVEEVQAIVKLCAETKTPLVAAGGRNGICGACLPRRKGTVMLDMVKMDKIVILDEDVMTVTVEAGLRWAELIHRLDDKGYKLGFRGPYGGNVGTVGGSTSINSIGYAASKYGPSPESTVSLEVVLANGDVLQTGTGWNPDAQIFGRYSTYNDLTGIFLGDQGTLGVKTKVTLKIYPKAEFITYGDFGFKTLEAATAAFLRVQKRGLTEELNLLADRQSTDTFFPGFLDNHKEIHAMFASIVQETDEQLANRKMEIVREIALEHGGKDLGNFASQMHWGELFNLVQPLYNNGFWLNTCHLRPITRIPDIMKRAWEIFKKYELLDNGIKWIASCLGAERAYATGWITLFPPSQDKMELAETAWNELLDAILDTGGCPYWNGLLWENRTLPITNKEFLETYWKIKKALDPDGIFAPGTFRGFE